MRQSALLTQFSNVVSFLGRSLGPSYEVVLYDAKNDFQIIAIANGELSGRTVGDACSPTIRFWLQNGLLERQSLVNICTKLDNPPRQIRSSVLILRNQQQKVEGLLALNFDDSKFHQLQQQIFDLIHPLEYVLGQRNTGEINNLESDLEIINESISSVADKLSTSEQLKVQSSALPYQYLGAQEHSLKQEFEQILGQYAHSRYGATVAKLRYNAQLTTTERRSLVKLLNQHGFFSRKGAIQFVAAELNCSTPTVYRYLKLA